MKVKVFGILIALLLSFTSVFAADSCGAGKCGAGKCGAAMMKDSKEACDLKGKDHKCDCKDKKKCTCETKEKCTCNMKKDMKGSCGAGKCGSDMKNEMKDEMKDTPKTK